MKLKKLVASIVLMSFILVDGFGSVPEPQIDANSLIRLEDYLRYASLNNAELKAKLDEWKAAL